MFKLPVEFTAINKQHLVREIKNEDVGPWGLLCSCPTRWQVYGCIDCAWVWVLFRCRLYLCSCSRNLISWHVLLNHQYAHKRSNLRFDQLLGRKGSVLFRLAVGSLSRGWIGWIVISSFHMVQKCARWLSRWFLKKLLRHLLLLFFKDSSNNNVAIKPWSQAQSLLAFRLLPTARILKRIQRSRSSKPRSYGILMSMTATGFCNRSFVAIKRAMTLMLY